MPEKKEGERRRKGLVGLKGEGLRVKGAWDHTLHAIKQTK